MMKWDIQSRVLFIALAPAAAIALLLAGYYTHSRFDDLDRALKDRGMAIARHLASASEYGAFAGSSEVLNKLVTAAKLEPDVKAVVIVVAASDLVVVAGQPANLTWMGTGLGAATHTAETAQTLEFSAPILQSQTQIEDFFDGVDAAVKPAEAAPKILGRVYVEISRAALIEQRQRLLLYSLFITLAGLGIGALLALRLSGSLSRPLQRLTETVGSIGEGDFDARVAPDPSAALTGLEQGVNQMAQALKSARDNLEQRINDATAELQEKKLEAEQANASKSRFLAAASHDLRQPMHALGLFASELNDRIDKLELTPHTDDLRRVAGRIEASVAALEELFDALLDISRLDAGALTPSMLSFPLAALFKKIEDNFGAMARDQGLHFKVVPTEVWVRSDRVLMERILTNLVSNALRYTSNGGVLVGARRHRGKISIEVWDSGIGIPKDQQVEIFQEFVQLHNPERDRHRGLGLGLAIVDRLARLLRHRISVSSAPGKGSVFKVLVAKGTVITSSAASTGDSPLLAIGALRAFVVVVDDDVLVLTATAELLASWGCRVVAADSGNDAVAKLVNSEAVPDLIICDYRLREMETGFWVISRLRQMFASDIPAIVVTGDTAADLARQAQSLGAQLLHKPVRPAKLRALLAHILR